MKILRYLICIGVWVSAFQSAQGQLRVELDEFETKNRVFAGTIGDSLGVTFCLNVHAMSSGNLDFYAVSGWYQYDKYNKPIPVVGIHTDELILYRFDKKEKADTLLNFEYDDYDKRTFWDMMDAYTNMEGFTEKLSFSYDGYEEGAGVGRLIYGWWEDGEQRLPIKIYESDVDILKRQSILHFQHAENRFSIDLSALNLRPYGHTLRAYKKIGERIRVVLDFQRPSRMYALGMCGAGTEEGFVWLEVDDKGHVLDTKEYITESCLRSITSEIIKESDDVIQYIVRQEDGETYLTFHQDTLALTW